MPKNTTKKPNSFMEKMATFIVDKRTLFFLLYIFALIFSLFSMNWVEVENDVTNYLPEDTETRQGIVAMNENFPSIAGYPRHPRHPGSLYGSDLFQPRSAGIENAEHSGITKMKQPRKWLLLFVKL